MMKPINASSQFFLCINRDKEVWYQCFWQERQRRSQKLSIFTLCLVIAKTVMTAVDKITIIILMLSKETA